MNGIKQLLMRTSFAFKKGCNAKGNSYISRQIILVTVLWLLNRFHQTMQTQIQHYTRVHLNNSEVNGSFYIRQRSIVMNWDFNCPPIILEETYIDIIFVYFKCRELNSIWQFRRLIFVSMNFLGISFYHFSSISY